MDDNSTAYQGSMAFAQSLALQEHVSLSTGALTLTRPLVSLPGINSSICLDISLVYSVGTPPMLGLPANWSFNIPYVMPGASLTVGGQTSVIDPNWSDQDDYSSGLRYENNHGIQFQEVDPPQPLPSGNSGSYSFVYCYSDGSRDYFDAAGKLLEHDDLFGSCNYFSYADPSAGVGDTVLTSVTDSYGQTVAFAYDSNSVTISLPNGCSITINYSDDGVESLVDELGLTTSFSFESQSGYSVVDQISYPTGLVSQVSYTAIAYATGAGDSAFPAVSSLLRLDGGTTFLNQNNYAYGQNTDGGTYTGYNAGYLLDSATDGLMDSNNTTYLYDVTVSVVDAGNKLLAYTEYYYNYLHCLMTRSDFLLDGSGDPQPCLQTVNTYEVDTDWNARTTNYSKPLSVTTQAWSAAASAFQPMRQSTFTYDLFGNPLAATVAIYDSPSQSYVTQSTSTFTYVGASWGGEMPLAATVADMLTGFSRSSAYTLTSDQKCIASTVESFCPETGGTLQQWKTTNCTYDQQGRRLSVQLAWSAGASNPNPQLTLATTTSAYAYDLGSQILTETTTDPLGNAAVNKVRTSYPNGVLVEAITPLGQSSTFTYDAIGRLTDSTDPMGRSVTMSYDCLQQSGANRVQMVSETGYTVDVYCDGLGRHIKVADNGITPGSVTRVLSETIFGAQGLPVSTTGILGLSTTYQYDALGRLISSTDPHGNATTIAFGDMQLDATTSVNGVRRSQQAKDNLDRPIVQARFAAPSDSSIDYYVSQLTTYNGLGQSVSVTLQQCPVAGGQPTTLRSSTMTYDADGMMSGMAFAGFLSQRVDATKAVQRDLFGNVCSYSKTVSYQGGQDYQWNSEVFAYDAGNNMVSRTNQAGQAETFSYTPNGRVASRTRYDGTTVAYTYDANGNLNSVASGGSLYTYSYYPDNRLESLSVGGAVIGCQYFVDGVLQQITYPDGKSQTITVDQYNRIVAVADVAGGNTAITYNAVGQIVTKQCGQQQLSYSYDVVNGLNDILTGATLNGAATLTYAYTYDGFDRIATSSTSMAGQAGPMLDATYSYDAGSRMVALATTSGTAATNSNFTYDGLDQLTTQAVTAADADPATTAFLYDGNTNVVSCTANGTTQAFTYNNIDQLQQSGINYDANGRVVQDSAGNSFTYDAFDRLTASTGGAGTIKYAYYPDGLLASRNTAADSATFYYSDGTASQVHSSSSGQDTWLNYMFNGQTRAIGIDDSGAISYFMAADNSTAAAYEGSTLTQLQYEPYGSPVGQQQTNAPSFAWKQEYTDPDNGLVYLRSRFYNPSLMRFMSMDTYPVSNRYAFGDGNPIDNVDPTGHLSQAAAMTIGIAVGVVATLLSGGALGAVASMDIGASMAVGAVSGGIGSVASDGTTAALSGQSFTAQRAGIDLLSGAAGGAAGALAGGYVGQKLMAFALEQGLSRGAITVIGAVSSSVIGGAAASVVSAAVTSAGYGQPFFSPDTAMNIAMGTLSGIGGGLLASGAYMGRSARMLPVEADAGGRFFQFEQIGNRPNPRIVNFTPSDGAADLGDPAVVERLTSRHVRDAVVVHGGSRLVFPETRPPTMPGNVNQPMTPEAFADLLRNNYGIGGLGGKGVNLWSCNAARLGYASVAQRIATRLNVDVYAPASRGEVGVDYTGEWIQYLP